MTNIEATVMSSSIMSVLEDRNLLKAFAAFNITWIAAVGGAAVGMYLFSVPVIETGQDFSTEIMLKQFHHLIDLGTKYLQGGSRIQGLTLSALTWLLYRHPDPDVSRSWPYFFLALLTGIQVAWYEVVFVFPINDKLIAMEGRLHKMDEKSDRAMRPKVLDLLEAWRGWHIGRIVIPFAAVAIAFAGLSL